MKKIVLLLTILLSSTVFAGCSEEVEKSLDSEEKAALTTGKNQDIGNGSFEILSTHITSNSNELELIASGIDEDKITYIYIANKEVLKEKMKNGQVYKLPIKDVDGAHNTDYDPKVQLVQYEKNNEDKDFTMFKEERYQVEK